MPRKFLAISLAVIIGVVRRFSAHHVSASGRSDSMTTTPDTGPSTMPALRLWPFPNQAIQAMFVSTIGAPSGHTRTYMGFSDGTLGWMVNPCVPNPAACSRFPNAASPTAPSCSPRASR